MDLQAVDQPLWAFVDPEGNRDVAGFPLIIPVHGGAYLDVAKAVRAVEVRDRLLILAAEGLAVTAMPQIEGGRLDEQPLPNDVGREIAIALDIPAHQLVARAAGNHVLDLL